MVKGSTNLGAEWRNVMSTMRIHPNYNSRTLAYDFMVFKIQPSTKTPATLNDNGAYPAVNQDLRVCGFGNTSEGGKSSRKLRKVTIKTINQSTCTYLLGKLDSAAEMVKIHVKEILAVLCSI